MATAELTQPASPPADAPDWQSVPGGIPCPMCDYDLRGLTEPMCPECGYRFEWRSLLDPALKRHPYLFEHHPRRNVRSFFRTQVGGLLPRRFWRSLRPSQPSHPRRLIAYWLLATLLVFVWPLVNAGRLFHADSVENDNLRARVFAGMQQALRRPTTGPVLQEIARAGGLQGWVDQRHPPTWSWPYIKAWFVDEGERYSDVRVPGRWRAVLSSVHVALLYAAWPWLTLATLMIFRASMRRAKVKPVHVLRCALYCCDAGVLLVPLAAATGIRGAYLFIPALGGAAIDYRMVAALVFAAYTAYRLSAAYGLYMRFDRPAATAVASQAIVLLLAVIVLSWWPPYSY